MEGVLGERRGYLVLIEVLFGVVLDGFFLNFLRREEFRLLFRFRYFVILFLF